MQKIGIIHGKIYSEGQFIDANLYWKDETISCLSKEILECEEIIDAKGCLVLPGLIDPHVHFHLGVGANVNEDDFEEGSRKGLLGGITTYIDFLDPVTSSKEIEKSFHDRRALAEKSLSDYAFHGTVANPSGTAKELMESYRDLGITSVKLFTTYSDTDRRTYDQMIYELLQNSARTGAKVVIHAENDAMITANEHTLVRDHEKSRPVISERSEVVKLAEMAKDTNGHLYIVHVSAGSTVRMLKEQYENELRNGTITLESCPHYFLLNSSLYEQEDGFFYTMTPPLRPEEDRVLLKENIDLIHTLGTDHCPYPTDKKNRKLTSQIPMGIGGIQYSFLTMYTLFGNQIIEKYTKNPAKAYGLYPDKGSLQPGASADVVLFNPEKTTVISDEKSVYNHMECKGAIEKVFLRGKLVAEDGKVYPSKGNYLFRKENNV